MDISEHFGNEYAEEQAGKEFFLDNSILEENTSYIVHDLDVALLTISLECVQVFLHLC